MNLECFSHTKNIINPRNFTIPLITTNNDSWLNLKQILEHDLPTVNVFGRVFN